MARNELNEVYRGPAARTETVRTVRPVFVEQQTVAEVKARALQIHDDINAAQAKLGKKASKKARKAAKKRAEIKRPRPAREALESRRSREAAAPEPQLSDLSPQEFRARATAELLPEGGGRWTPRPPMSLSDYLNSGV